MINDDPCCELYGPMTRPAAKTSEATITARHESIHLYAPPAYATAADPAIPGRTLEDLPYRAADQVRDYLYGQLRDIPIPDTQIGAAGAWVWQQVTALVVPPCGHKPVVADAVVADVVVELTCDRLKLMVRPRALLYPSTCGRAAANCPPQETSTTFPIIPVLPDASSAQVGAA